MLDAMRRARRVTVSAYVLAPGRMLNELLTAARSGALVEVRVEARPFADRGGTLARLNADAVARLRAFGADARLVDADDAAGEPPLHMKAVIADGELFLDDRNFTDDDRQTIVRDDRPRDLSAVRAALVGRSGEPSATFATDKSDALAQEARRLRAARGRDRVMVESESFGAATTVFAALDELGKRGMHPQLLVAARELASNPREARALGDLAKDGVEIRVTNAAEKFAVAAHHAWLGSANATSWPARERDWGLSTGARAVVAHLRAAFASRWADATPLGQSE